MRKIILLAVSALFLNACASSNSGSTYSRNEARKVQTVKTGVVESVRTVKIEGTKSAIGPAVGGVVGGVAGSSIGGRRESVVGAVLGATVGAIAGAVGEEMVTKKDGLEITVKMPNGTLLAIVQEADDQFKPGETVRLIENGDVTRVSH